MDLALALVELSSGHWAVIDAADAPAVGRFNWFAKVFRHTTYGWRRITGDSRGISLHRFIGTLMGLELTATVDHENGNGLDCRRSNLRDATAAQQRQNTSAHGDSWTGIKGVTWNKRRGLWRARITQDGRTHELGYFTTSDEAAQAYAHAAATMFGEFASTRTAH